MSKKKVMIELDNVSKIYKIGGNEIYALKDISFKVFEKDFLVILGKSGSGKTTIVNQIGLLDTPTIGKIILDGLDTTKLDENKLAIFRGKKIGYIFQKFNLIKTLNTLENVELPLVFQSIDKSKREEISKKYLKKFEMEDRLYNKPSELSGGQQQRVAIARALVNEPKIILADEPTGNLDSKTGEIVAKYLKKLNDEGRTIILVTHDEKLSKIGNRKIVLKDGKIISQS